MIEWTCVVCGDVTSTNNHCHNCDEDTEHLYFCSDGESFDDENEAIAHEQAIDDGDMFFEDEEFAF